MPKHKKDSKVERTNNQEVGLIFSSLEEIARKGAQEMIRVALECEIEDFIKQHKDLLTSDGKMAIVRNGYHEPRKIVIGGGVIEVEVPSTRNRTGGLNFISNIVPSYMRRRA